MADYRCILSGLRARRAAIGQERKRLDAAIVAIEDVLIEFRDPFGKSLLAVELGRRGGLKGGPARAKKLSKEQRAASARTAAMARWNNRG